jgi:hypothetical protein
MVLKMRMLAEGIEDPPCTDDTSREREDSETSEKDDFGRQSLSHRIKCETSMISRSVQKLTVRLGRWVITNETNKGIGWSLCDPVQTKIIFQNQQRW